MNAHYIAIVVLLALAVVVTALSALGVLLMKDPLDKLHFLSAVATVAAAAVLAAVWLQEGVGQALIKTAIICILGLINNAVVTHATARAARIRQHGSWMPHPHENIAPPGSKP